MGIFGKSNAELKADSDMKVAELLAQIGVASIKASVEGTCASAERMQSMMSGMADVPWDKVETFAVDWKTIYVDGLENLVPIMVISMKEESNTIQKEIISEKGED